MNCTRCDGTGFLNLEQVGAAHLESFTESGEHEIILKWIEHNSDHDVSVCDCCGDGSEWYGTPGEHNPADPDEMQRCGNNIDCY